MRLPRWYCPPGVDRPAHAVVPGIMRCTDTGGPPGAIPGGLCYGGPVETDEHGWIAHPSGHWFNFTDADPAVLLRLDPHPRLVRWRDIGGSQAGQTWHVPALLSPKYDEKSGELALFVSALDRIWTGDGWNTPAEITDLQRRLLTIHHQLGTGSISLDSPEAVQVALDVLRLSHVFDDYEITKAGWVSEVLVVRTLLAAVEMDIAEGA